MIAYIITCLKADSDNNCGYSNYFDKLKNLSMIRLEEKAGMVDSTPFTRTGALSEAAIISATDDARG